MFTEKILKQNGIFELFDQIVGANLDGSMTDKTEVMQEAMRRAGGKENNTFFMVGDRSFDMIGAKNCGVPGIGVYFGFAEPGELEEAGADYTCLLYTSVPRRPTMTLSSRLTKLVMPCCTIIGMMRRMRFA